jgi:hypothetical protein
MGLDIVEMCMDIEKAFGIDVPDEEWQEATTVGKAYETVYRHLGIPAAESYEGTEEWEKLLDVIERSAAVNRIDLHWYANFVRDLRLD